MRMSESEFKRFCQNRQVRVQVQGSSILESLVGQGEKKKSPKYKNRKVYVYKSGVALYEKMISLANYRVYMIQKKNSCAILN